MLYTIVFSILGVILGILIDKFLLNKGNVDWQSKFEISDKEAGNIKKQLKQEKKKLHKMGQQKESIENKLKTTEEKYIPLTEGLNNKISENNQELLTYREKYKKLESNHTSTEYKLEELKKKYKDLQETYAIDMKDSQGWKTKRDRLENEISSWEKKYVGLQKEYRSLEATVERQKKRIAEVSEYSREFKTIQASNRKLTKDLKYWEQKHFDTNHELAQLKVDMESLQNVSKETDLLLKGSELEKENIVKKIAEYKTKFVNVNNLYHILKGEKEKMS